jgi:hypothetical protein
MSAKTDLLDLLANHLAKGLLERIQSETATAADFQAARQFLKDNGVQFGDPKSEPMQNLVKSLPFAGEDHEDAHPYKN